MAGQLSFLDLEPVFQCHSIEPASPGHGRTLEDGSIQWGGFPVTTWRRVKKRASTDRVSFLCPACYRANGGKVGTHRIGIDFIGGRTPDKDCVHNDKGQPVRWTASNDPLATLTLSPSIQIIGGCTWHGYVRNGRSEDA